MSDLIWVLLVIVGLVQVLIGIVVVFWDSDWMGQYWGKLLVVVCFVDCDQVVVLLWLVNVWMLLVVLVFGNIGLNGGVLGMGVIVILLVWMNCICEICLNVCVVVVEVGVIVDSLNVVVEEYGLIFLLVFGVSGLVMIGGVLFINVGGVNVLCYGNVCDLCLGLEVVLFDGWVLDLMQVLYKNNFGFDLCDLLIGVEGQFGIIIVVVMKLYFCLVE